MPFIPEEKEGFTLVDVNTVDLAEALQPIQIDGSEDEVCRFKKVLSFYLSHENFPETKVFKTNHVDYLANYLRYYDPKSGFYVNTIIVEHHYISNSYLKDYSSYYSLGYKDYLKGCRRVHFFEYKMNVDTFNDLISGAIARENKDLREEIWSTYLGNISVKPLPNSLIGASLVRNYDEYFENLKGKRDKNIDYKSRQRYFTATKNYVVNVFGKRLEYKTLVFQEQDKIIAACATIAIWTATHKTSGLFKAHALAPSEITELAGLGEKSGRNLPNAGLDVRQIAKAINATHPNMVCEVYNAKFQKKVPGANVKPAFKVLEPWQLKRVVYGYLKFGLPILVGFKFIGTNRNHIVTLTGYRFEKPSEKELVNKVFREEKEIKLESDRIQRFFAHDDQLGPYSKIGFGDDYFPLNLKVNWRGQNRYEDAYATLIVVPIIDIIRVKYDDIESFASKFNKFLHQIYPIQLHQDIIWDIYLSDSNNYKQEIVDQPIDDDIKITTLKRSFPKYVWIARAKYMESLDEESLVLADFILDATNHSHGDLLFNILYFNATFRETLKNIIREESFIGVFRDIFHSESQLDILLNSLKSP